MNYRPILLLLLTLSTTLFQACRTAKTTTGSGNTDSSRPQIEQAMVKALQWQEANPIFSKAPTDWTNGAYYTGVTKAHQATGNRAFLDALTGHGQPKQMATLRAVLPRR